MSTWYPRLMNSQYGWTSSAHQNPMGHPVCPETAGLDAMIATDRGFAGLRRSIAAPMRFGAWAKSTVVRPCGFRTCGGRGDDTRDRHRVGTLRVPPETPPPTVFR